MTTSLTTQSTPPRPAFVSIARWILVILAGIFTLGALGQFFLVGLGMFKDGTRWQDHQTLGHIIGLLPYVMWIPAVMGRASRGMLLGTLMLFVLYMAQYAFINVDSGIANAFHPLNGSILLMLGSWLTWRSIELIRHK